MNVENYKNISFSLISFIEQLKEENNKNKPDPDTQIDIISFWILLVFLMVFFGLSLYFFLNLFIHYLYNRKNPNYKFFIFWIDYFFISFISGVFVVSYLIFLIINILFKIIMGEKIDRENTAILKDDFSFDKFLMWGPSFTLLSMIFVIIDNLILDIIHFFLLIRKMYKLYCIKDYDNIKEVYEKCKDENFNDIFNSKIHFLFVIFICLLDIFALIYFGKSMSRYKKLEINQVIYNIKQIKNNEAYFIFEFDIFIAVLKIIQVFVLLLIIIFMITSTFFKKHILESNYYNNNILVQKIYNSAISKISFHKDFFTFKTILDFLMNIPALLYFSLEQLSTIPIIIGGFCLLVYIFFMGAMFLYIEKSYKMSNISEKLNNIFLLNKLNFKFGERERKIQIEALNFEYNEFEVKVMNELSTSIKVSQELIKKEKEQKFLTSDLIITDIDNEEGENDMCIDLSKEENYFIIFKLIYLFFKQNQQIYEKIEKEMEKSLSFKNNQNKSNENINKKNINSQDYLVGIEKITNLTKIYQKEINQSFNIGGYNIFYSLEEKEYREKFKENNKIDENTYIKKSGKLFNIESYIDEELFSLFPFCQITINDILNSINPIFNKQLFEKFIKEKNKNENEKQEKDNNSNLESNYFYTFNSHLSFEAYDENEQFNFKFLKIFISNYNNYLMNKLKNNNYTFLPLIIGVFKISYLKKAKIIILYRNSLLFSHNNKFQIWYNLFNYGSETILQKKNKEFLNLEEIEKKNITLIENDYNELIKSLNKDIDFIKDYSIFPIFNLFIGINEDSKNENMIKDENKINDKNESLIINNKNSFSDLNMNIYMTNNDNKTQSISLFEKEYNCILKNENYSIKLYFTNFFRNNNKNNKDIENNEGNNLSNEKYINFIKNEILKYIK